MKRWINNSDGSSLILVLLMVVIFTVLGTALLGSTLTGVKNVNFRQHDTQALHSSQMGVDYALAYIDSSFDDYRDEEGSIDLTSLGYNPEDFGEDFSFVDVFTSLLLDILQPFQDGYASPDQNFTLTFDPTDLDLRESDSFVEGNFDIKSIGTSGGVSKEIIYTLSLSASGVFEVLSYAVGAEGNVFLHGASTIEGDLYTGNNLYVYNHAQVFSSGDHYIPSLYPCVDSDNSTVLGQIIRVNNISNYQRHLNQNTHASYTSMQPEHYANVFSCSPPTISSVEADFSSIEATSSENRFKINSPDVQPNGDHRPYLSWRYLELEGSYADKLVKPRFNSLSPRLNYTQHFGGLHLEGDSDIRDGANLTFGWQDASGAFRGGLYVDGNLYIGDRNTSSNANNVNNYEDISIKGPVYVTGDLIIRGADVQFDSTLYVAGDTEIRNSRLRGIQSGEEGESSLVLFGDGEVKISNISSFENDRSRISRVRGFFYSNERLEIYGVGSNIEIEGGIFAKDIVLNAIRGDSFNQNNRWGYYSPSGVSWSFERSNRQATLSSNDSRLRIKHNPNLIENPPDALPSADNIVIRESNRNIIN
ncbi:hypothetical protein J2T56_000974 [Natronobacillus azotifigens]|uniref:Type 4 fimbrial biogenesis protein PilX N-terminal domain-containing protein n=1 Tax=Natronobacillus azotifigens TaxID=472978 RepID=A0A9J6RA03_9BACI|nr:hypothetical protein [Natronobacillus azotifigens]MCZ0702413.1 hypothetical protein [Natronobacillus azotifigens]